MNRRAFYCCFVMLPLTVGAAPGEWTQYGTSSLGGAAAVALSPDQTTVWMATTTVPGYPTSWDNSIIIGTSSFANASFESFPNAGLDNAFHDLQHSGIGVNKFGQPLLLTRSTVAHGSNIYNKSPYVFYYNPATETWAPASFPANEVESWNGSPNEFVTDDNGDLLLCGRDNVLGSTDGKVWSVRSNLRSFIYAPPPYSPNYGANGQPAWVGGTGSTNTPSLNTSTFDWQFGFARMPWGEMFIGGEATSYVHSLDNGQTWEWFDPLMYQPQRDSQGYPMYRNPACHNLVQLFGAGPTKDGEVMFFSDRNYAEGILHNIYIWSAAGHVIEAQQGLPMTVDLHPGPFSKLVTLPSGDTFMSVYWLPAGTVTPGDHIADVFKWDGSSWTVITPPAPNWQALSRDGIFSDGTHLYVGSGGNGGDGLYQWTPDTSQGAPPVVTIAGGTSASAAPTTPLSAATGLASVTLSAAVIPMDNHAVTYQWASRGPAAVTFDDANARSPRVWFDTPGNYVLNLQATDSVNTLRAGASVIVHVLAAVGGSPPVIISQPQQQILISGSTATFSVQATGTALRYQWRRNRADIPGATSSILTFTAKNSDLGATYYCLVRNPYGKIVSNCGSLGGVPTIIGPPVDHIVPVGTDTTLSVAAAGAQPLRWQWRKNGVIIAGANLPSYTTHIPGAYSVDVSNIFGTVTSSSGTLSNGTANTYSMVVSPSISTAATADGIHPPGAAIPLAVEAVSARGVYEIFDKWTTNTQSGVTATFANRFSSQTTLTITGANAAGATVNVFASYRILPPYYLTVANGTGTLKSIQNAVVAIAAQPAPPGYVFDQWRGASVLNPTSPQTTLTLTTTPTVVTAAYIRPYTIWKNQKFGIEANNPSIAGDLADPDQDSIANLLEYALGTNPMAAGPSALPVAGSLAIGGQTYLSYTFTRSAADLTYTVMVSDDLNLWTAGSRYSPDGDTPTTGVTTDITPGGQPQGYTLVRLTTPTSGIARRFIKLRISTP